MNTKYKNLEVRTIKLIENLSSLQKEYTTLKVLHVKDLDENKLLNSKITEMADRYTSMDISYTNKINQSKEELKKLHENYNKIVNELREYKNNVSKTTTMIEEYEQKNKLLHDKCTHIYKKYETTGNELSNNLQELKKYKDQCKCQIHIQTIQGLNSNISVLKNDIAKIQSIRKKEQDYIHNEREKYAETVKHYDEKLDNCNGIIYQNKLQHHKLKDLLHEADNKIQSLNTKYSDECTKYNNQCKITTEYKENLTTYKNDNISLRTDLNKSNQDIHELNKHIEKLQVQHQDEYNKFNVQLDKQIAICSKLDSELIFYKGKLSSMNDYKEKTIELEKELKNNRNVYNNLRVNYSELQFNYTKLSTEYKKLENNLSQMDQMSNNMKDDMSKMQGKMNLDNKNYKNTIEKLQSQYKTRIDEIKHTYQLTCNEKQECEKKNEKLADTLETYIDKLKQMSTENRKYINAIENLETNHKLIIDQLNSCKTTINKLELENNQLLLKQGEYDKQITRLTDTNSKCHTTIQQLQSANEQLANKLDSAPSQDTLNNAIKTRDLLAHQYIGLQNHIKKLETDLETANNNTK